MLSRYRLSLQEILQIAEDMYAAYCYIVCSCYAVGLWIGLAMLLACLHGDDGKRTIELMIGYMNLHS